MNEIAILPIPDASNPADLFSKEFKSDSTFRHLQDLTLFYPSSFQHTQFNSKLPNSKFSNIQIWNFIVQEVTALHFSKKRL
jgi:hypothetical protein